MSSGAFAAAVTQGAGAGTTVFLWDGRYVFWDDDYDSRVTKYDYRGIGSGDHSGLGFWYSEYVAVAGWYIRVTKYDFSYVDCGCALR